MAKYNPKTIEKKWQKYWADQDFYTSKDNVSGKENYMLLTEFPYPSGNLHIGHWYAFALPDIKARYLRMKGKNVLYPIGFDAFGLPAENAAIKHGVNPRDWTKRNITFMTKQLKSMGATFDWSRKVETIDPEYYKWTQWMFLKFYEKGLAYRAVTKVNWCPKDKTVLANEQVVNGRCDRCDAEVVQKDMTQWMFKITEFADALYDDIDDLDWPEMTKAAQKNWIGKSEGLLFTSPVKDMDLEIQTFSTHFEAFFADTFVVIAPDHPLLKTLVKGIPQEKEVLDFAEELIQKRLKEGYDAAKEPEGIFTGRYTVDPVGNGELPIWVANYAIADYGTGIVKASCHDERDFAFAKKYGISLKEVLEPIIMQTKGSSAFHINEPFVDSYGIIVLLKHWTEDKYLGLKWRDASDWGTLVTGGIDEGMTAEETVRKEILEETGYKNIKSLRKITTIHSKYYHVPKKQNRFGHAPVFVVELANGEQDQISKDESSRHELMWLTPKELKTFLTAESHQLALRKLVDNFAWTDMKNAVLSEPSEFAGKVPGEYRNEIADFAVKKGFAVKTTKYRLRDWILSRQRYWGVPIPMIHCADCGYLPVSEEELPVKLPTLKNYMPSDDGRSPLARSAVWLKAKCPKCGGQAERETDTMDTFVDSSWYFMRYTDPKNKNIFASKEQMAHWLPVPSYLGGAEHNTMHLLYSRFFIKALHSLGYVDFNEPFLSRRNRGTILGPDGQKMSKSRGNVIDPDIEVTKYGADTVRMYLCFMGPYLQGGPWDPKGIVGVHRFIHRVWTLAHERKISSDGYSEEMKKEVAKAIKTIERDIEDLNLNTCISALMKFMNAVEDLTKDLKTIPQELVENLALLLAPFAPHLAEELWQKVLKHTESVHLQSWPRFDEKILEESVVKIAVQINGKVRDVIEIGKNLSEKEAKDFALANETIIRHLGGKEVKKFIYIPGRIINIVV